ncbi:MAG: nicotinamide-nucleotide amidohydrolase family protein, partial [Fimbriimonadaceae bacterium]|nr:nicotinamide-nucleotide amidohydrolase family protein [Fimbriimonadaceae bacterium]
PEVEEGLRRLFASRGLRWAETNLRQALKPEGAALIPNPNGTAPGFWCRDDEGGFYCALPGPPNEFNPMVESFLIPRLASLGDGLVFHSTVLKIAGIGESRLEEILGDLMAGEDPTMSPYAKTGEVHLRLTTAARSAPEAAARLDPLEAEVRRRVGPAVYARNDESMAQAILNLLVDRRETLALAESMTCGMIGAELTSVSGMSAVLKGGVMAYSRSAKSDLLGVPHDLPVYSAECAAAMATGARRALAADWGLSVTGLAQADGSDVPAGSVWIGVSGPGGVERVETHRFIGTREAVRQRTTTFALGLLRRLLLGLP